MTATVYGNLNSKILLTDSYRVNVMCSLNNDIHDIFPSIWNMSHYLIVFIFSNIYLRFTCYQLSNGSLSSISFLNRLARKFYRIISLYMLDPWCSVYHLISDLYWWFLDLFTDFYSKRYDKIFLINSIYRIIVLVIWILCTKSAAVSQSVSLWYTYICISF